MDRFLRIDPLSTALFAPRSLALLGWAFLLTGLSVPVLADKINDWVDSVPTVLMGVSFGVYHIIFAAFNWRARKTKADRLICRFPAVLIVLS